MSQALKNLSERLGNPGIQSLWLAARKEKINVKKADVKEFVEAQASKQVLGRPLKSEGKTATEDANVRWQMDLMYLRDNKDRDRYALIIIDTFSRKLWTKTLANKTSKHVAETLQDILRANKHPKVITSDNGSEFLGDVSKLLADAKIVQRFKAPNDPNAIGVVDKAIQTLKQKLADLAGSTSLSWSQLLQRATRALNETPRETLLHGHSPNEAAEGKNPAVKFMLLQKQADNFAHNEKLKRKRVDKIENAKIDTVRPQLDIKNFNRSFRPTFGAAERVEMVDGSIVHTNKGSHNIKLVKPVPKGSKEPAPAHRISAKRK